jgi:hypothetical protein
MIKQKDSLTWSTDSIMACQNSIFFFSKLTLKCVWEFKGFTINKLILKRRYLEDLYFTTSKHIKLWYAVDIMVDKDYLHKTKSPRMHRYIYSQLIYLKIFQDNSFTKLVLILIGIYMKKSEVGPFLTPYMKMNSN